MITGIFAIIMFAGLGLTIAGIMKKLNVKSASKKKPLNIFSIGLVALIVGFIGVRATITPVEKLPKAVEQTQADSQTNSDTNENEPVVEEKDQAQKEAQDYQVWQAWRESHKMEDLFLSIDFNFNEQQLLKMIAERGLQYSKQEYNASPGTDIKYQIAIDKADTAQKYKKSHGNYVVVLFSKDRGDMKYASFHDEEDSSMKIAYIYNYGGKLTKSYSSTDKDYQGYYVDNVADVEGKGIEIQYSNGNKKKTGFTQCSSAQDALASVE